MTIDLLGQKNKHRSDWLVGVGNLNLASVMAGLTWYPSLDNLNPANATT